MRQTISAAVAAVAVIAAAPAMACGFDSCSPCGVYGGCGSVYVPAVPYSYTGCGTCGGWAYERLAEPTTQYYYVNQGPTYSGPGAFAPYPAYQESAVPVDGVYGDAPYYAYSGGRYAGAVIGGPGVYGYRWRRHYHYRPYNHSYRYGYRHHYYGYHHGYPRRYY
jgi:hypothetical protein